MGRRPLLVSNTTKDIMESIKNNFDLGSDVAPDSQPDQKVKVQIDRVTLYKNESEKINSWLRQIKESSKGFLDLTRSDLVNYLIKAHVDTLTDKEIKKIRQAHYSLIKHLNWITPQLKKALEANDTELVLALQAELRGLELGVIKSAKAATPEIEMSDLANTGKQRVKKSRSEGRADKIENNLTENNS